jgi:hypothetical protein
MGKLTAKYVENVTEPGTYEDGEGLRLIVKATGRKTGCCGFSYTANVGRWD